MDIPSSTNQADTASTNTRNVNAFCDPSTCVGAISSSTFLDLGQPLPDISAICGPGTSWYCGPKTFKQIGANNVLAPRMSEDSTAWDLLPPPSQDVSSASPATSEDDAALNQTESNIAGSTSAITPVDPAPRAMRKRGRPSEQPARVSAIPSPDQIRPPTASDLPAAKRNRIPHSIVERRYRNNINAQIDALATKVPLTSQRQRCASSTLDIEELAAYQARGPSKAEVLASTISYIEQLEEKSKNADAAMNAMRAQIAGLQKLVQCDDCAILKEFQDLTLAQGTVAV